jgi:hypothetical protein
MPFCIKLLHFQQYRVVRPSSRHQPSSRHHAKGSPLSLVHNCLLYIIPTILHIWQPSILYTISGPMDYLVHDVVRKCSIYLHLHSVLILLQEFKRNCHHSQHEKCNAVSIQCNNCYFPCKKNTQASPLYLLLES